MPATAQRVLAPDSDLALQLAGGEPLYRQVMEVVSQSINTGALRPGDRLPSLRKMSVSIGVSIPTVQQAYVELERQRRVESRPRSGFFVRHVAELPLVRAAPRGSRGPARYRSVPLVQRVYESIDRADLVPLGIANPTMARPATKALGRCMRRVMSRQGERTINYPPTLGEPALKRQLAFYLLDSIGAQIDPDSICITNGAQEALALSLQAVASSGDVVAVESPTYHGMLELVDSLGMYALEIETCPEEGINLSSLEQALSDQKAAAQQIKVCLFATTLNNPLGVSMPQADREQMLDLLARHGTVLIEDDVYGELRFDGHRAVPSQFLLSGETAPNKRRGSDVLTCGSFSKTVAPGYRVGWVISERHRDAIARLKRSRSCGSPALPQLTLADMLASGDYSRHVTQLRVALGQNAERMTCQLEAHFPSGTRISKPQGGGVLWVALPAGVDAEDLFDRALDAGVSIAPGGIFSPGKRYSNFVRLGYGHVWDSATERALQWLGREVTRLAS